jgi:glycosyltransferase involved in cell wall biosynthesis
VPERVLLVLATSTGGRRAATSPRWRRARRRRPGRDGRGAGLDRAAVRLPGHVEVDVGERPVAAARPARVRALRRLARDADVVHAHGLRAGALAVLTPAPVVVTLHNAVSGPVAAVLERLVARRAAVVLAAGADLAQRARQLGARDLREVAVAAPPLHTTGRDPGLGHPLVLAVGRLHPQKGYDTLLEALPALGDAVVAVAGDGPLEGELRRRAPQVRWLGRRDDVGDLIAAADVVVLPSVWEARSLTAQEALRAGRPLVATAVGGTPELVRDGAVLVPPGDAAALGRAVRRVLDDPAHAAELAARGRAVAATWPTADDAVAQVREVYRDVLR